MAITYKKITEVEAAAALNEGDELIINSAGALKRAPKSLLGLAQLRSDVDANAEDIAQLEGDVAAKAEIADGALDYSHALSGKRIADKLCRRLSASGAIAGGHFMPGYPLDYKAYAVPAQSGTGDASPGNVRPIVGVDTLAITQCGEITDSTADGYCGITNSISISTITDAQGAAIGAQYGGYIDSARGKFVQTHAVKIFDGSEAFERNEGSGGCRVACRALMGIAKPLNAIKCTHYNYSNLSMTYPDIDAIVVNAYSVVIIGVDGSIYPDAASFKSYLAAQYAAGTPVTIVYELITPIEHDIDALPAIIAGEGVTSVFADSGNVEIAGAVDPRWDREQQADETEQLRAAIVALGGTI